MLDGHPTSGGADGLGTSEPWVDGCFARSIGSVGAGHGTAAPDDGSGDPAGDADKLAPLDADCATVPPQEAMTRIVLTTASARDQVRRHRATVPNEVPSREAALEWAAKLAAACRCAQEVREFGAGSST